MDAVGTPGLTLTRPSGEPPMRRRLQVAIVGLGALIGGIAEWVWAPFATPLLVAIDFLTYGVYIVAGTLAWSRRPSNPMGKLLIVAGLTSFISGYWAFDLPVITPIGMTFQLMGSAVLFHALLAYPTGHLRGWFDRSFVALTYVLWVGVGFVIAVSQAGPHWNGCSINCDAGPTLTPLDDRAVGALWNFRVETYLPWGVGLLVVMAARWIQGSAVFRRIYGPVLLATFAFFVAAYISGVITGTESLVALYVAQAIVPVTMLFGLLRLRLVRGGVGGLVLELRAASTQGALQHALRRALRDPTLELLHVDRGTGRMLDDDGRPVDLPGDGTNRSVVTLERGGRLLGAIVHDPSLVDELELLEAASEAASLALENAWLQDELRHQLEEVRASRARIVATGDAERRRVERDLHDGAQQRLVNVALAIGEAQSQLRSGNAKATGQSLADASEGVRAALAEVRELARGIHPAILTEEGLVAAVKALAARSKVPVSVKSGNVGRLGPTVEATAYFVVAEALANAAKHAEARSVSVSIDRSDGVVDVEVADDGRGGADAAKGSGLSGIDDRVAALGGHLTVVSAPGDGTRIRATIPCG